MVSSTRKIQHLHWRAGFGLKPEEWMQQRNYPVQKAVDELFQQARTVEPIFYNPQAFGEQMKKQSFINKIVADWIHRMGNCSGHIPMV